MFYRIGEKTSIIANMYHRLLIFTPCLQLPTAILIMYSQYICIKKQGQNTVSWLCKNWTFCFNSDICFTIHMKLELAKWQTCCGTPISLTAYQNLCHFTTSNTLQRSIRCTNRGLFLALPNNWYQIKCLLSNAKPSTKPVCSGCICQNK